MNVSDNPVAKFACLVICVLLFVWISSLVINLMHPGYCTEEDQARFISGATGMELAIMGRAFDHVHNDYQAFNETMQSVSFVSDHCQSELTSAMHAVHNQCQSDGHHCFTAIGHQSEAGRKKCNECAQRVCSGLYQREKNPFHADFTGVYQSMNYYFGKIPSRGYIKCTPDIVRQLSTSEIARALFERTSHRLITVADVSNVIYNAPMGRFKLADTMMCRASWIAYIKHIGHHCSQSVYNDFFRVKESWYEDDHYSKAKKCILNNSWQSNAEILFPGDTGLSDVPMKRMLEPIRDVYRTIWEKVERERKAREASMAKFERDQRQFVRENRNQMDHFMKDADDRFEKVRKEADARFEKDRNEWHENQFKMPNSPF